MKHKDDAGWGPVDEDMFPPGMGMGMSQSVRGLDASHRVDSVVGSIHESQLFPMGSDLF